MNNFSIFPAMSNNECLYTNIHVLSIEFFCVYVRLVVCCLIKLVCLLVIILVTFIIAGSINKIFICLSLNSLLVFSEQMWEKKVNIELFISVVWQTYFMEHVRMIFLYQ